jgi:hypothetical protein
MNCRHCRLLPRYRWRLCQPCFRIRLLRDLYRPRRKLRLGRKLRLAPTPTDAPPGSPAKLAVLCTRARLRVALFHPDDVSANAKGPPD